MATIHEFQLSGNAPNGEEGPWTLASVVASEEEFSELISQIYEMSRATEIRSMQRISDDQIKALAQAKHIPLMARGTLTAPLFEMFGVIQNYMSVIVRGEGNRIAAEMGLGEIGEA